MARFSTPDLCKTSGGKKVRVFLRLRNCQSVIVFQHVHFSFDMSILSELHFLISEKRLANERGRVHVLFGFVVIRVFRFPTCDVSGRYIYKVKGERYIL